MIDAALLSYVGVMSVTPGPNNLLLAASGVQFGLRRTLPQLFGISTGHIIQVFLTAMTLGTLVSALEGWRPWLVVVGASYLLWLSWAIARAGVPGDNKGRQPIGFWEAALFQGVNPKAWVMVINIAVLFAPRTADPWIGALGLSLVCGLVNLPCVTLWAVAGDRLRTVLAQGRAALMFNGTMGTLMALTALWLVIEEFLLK